MPDFVRVLEASQMTAGQIRCVEVQGCRVALIRLGDEFHALDDACPHRGGPLSHGTLEGEVLHCPLHGWGFDARTGACDMVPTRPATAYRTRVVDGHVEVSIKHNV